MEDLFLKNDLIGRSLEASSFRDKIISNNIANAEVPGFKKKEVVFERFMQEELGKVGHGNLKGLDKGKLNVRVRTRQKGFSYSLDENNVDIEDEMAELYKNGIRFDVMAGSVIHNYKKIATVLNGIK